jgi:hypothetical protein
MTKAPPTFSGRAVNSDPLAFLQAYYCFWPVGFRILNVFKRKPENTASVNRLLGHYGFFPFPHPLQGVPIQ